MAQKKRSTSRKSTTKKNHTARGNAKRRTPAKTSRAPQKRQSSPLKGEILLLVLVVFAILSLLSLFDLCGSGGKLLSEFLFGFFGAVSYVIPFYALIAGGFYISNPGNREIKSKVYYSLGLLVSLCGLFQWIINSKADSMTEVFRFCSAGKNGGGIVGGFLAYLLPLVIGRAGAFVVITALFLLFFMLLSRKQIFAALKELYDEKAEERAERREYIEYEDYTEDYDYPEKMTERQMTVHTFEKEETPKKEKKEKTSKKKTEKKKTPVKEIVPVKEILPSESEKEPEPVPEPVPEPEPAKISIIRNDVPVVEEEPVYKEELEQKFGEKEKTTAVEEEIKKPVSEKKAQNKKTAPEDLEKEVQAIEEEIKQDSEPEFVYEFPSLDLLTKPKANQQGISDADLIDTATKLQQTLESFGVKVKMGDVSCGPSVTRYELVPEQGVKVSRITGLADDIKLSLAASDIRIEAPIPGKAAVGIEVPNAKRNMVTLRELLESSEFENAKSNVTFAVGKDIGGKTIVTDIAKMPHMLVAGATGSGKSVCINTLIMSILYKASPEDVKFIMVDPKMVELTAYADIPHLMIPVVTDPKKASAALNWAVQEMTGRYNKFAELGVREIKSYNKKIEGLKHNEDNTYEKMSQIVIIVDEFADLMMVAPGEVEDAVCRLAQLARAAGIHLVLATQRPSVNVITGLIKANIPSRIALSVSSAIDSRTIIDGGGAEKLLGNGDMLFAPQDYPKPVRVQGAFVSDEERDNVVAFLKQQGAASYNDEITKHIESNPVGQKGNASGVPGGNEQDELFAQVAKFIIEKDKASIGMLQRAFRIGFNRAARIMDQLCDAGIVGPEEGTKPRTILMSMEQLENLLESGDL